MDFEERPASEGDLLALLRIKLKYDIPLTTNEAAFLRGCAPETLIRERIRGGGTAPFINIGRAIRYPARPYVEWLRDRPSRASTSEPFDNVGGTGKPGRNELLSRVRQRA
jgi:hypothetical protein